MKKSILIIILFFLLISCEKNRGYQDSGTIIGFDYRKCMCCGGWFIVIQSDTLRFWQLPEETTLKLDNATYPVEVYLDWHFPDPQCLGDEIIVTRIEEKK